MNSTYKFLFCGESKQFRLAEGYQGAGLFDGTVMHGMLVEYTKDYGVFMDISILQKWIEATIR